ncbi:GSCOCT00008609001.2-RA-CDS [Cotesia congregata]|uniref:Pattern recognition serine proteinase n=1 Tax=Cotesia congregata TaxID=51543 RepID=A0A8J2EHB3_COTCN|nr:GSCOCT00008609001.2-RA-CDS [Cotesia congregata]CAG5075518.1 Pattern recognition serine proteinase precursor [Cotesia congregata]
MNLKVRCVIFSIQILGLLQLSHSQDTCELNQFRCANEQCITGEFLCDGKQDCMDGSDETRHECLKTEIICPQYAFRCDYGACIDGDALCNGVDDCVDKSDEKSSRCRGSITNASVVNSGNCGVNQFKCNSGQCIDDIVVCDGSPDCSDRSDETSATCSSHQCPKFTFQCAYGACIDGDKKCDGIRNCVDGSDEEFILCSEKKIAISSTTQRTKNQVTSTTSSPWIQPQSICFPPEQPQNGRWKLHKSQCQSNEHCDANQNTVMIPGTYLVYSCNPGYELKGSSDIFCGPKSKWSSEPECVEIRCKPLSSVSTVAECDNNNEWISCEMPVPPGTSAKISCRDSYRQDTTVLGLQRDIVRCNAKGQWEPKPIHCIPVCGIRSTSLNPLIVKGGTPNISDFPWHATLYKSESRYDEKLFICGATIIQNDMLITAAHCVYNEEIQKVESPEKFSIATGNIFRDFNSLLHDSRLVHKRNVKNIFIDCNYSGNKGRYTRDIAILQIDKVFTFTQFLVPACLDITNNDHIAIDVGQKGSVAGFGRTELGPSSGMLQSLTVPVVPLSHCKSASLSNESDVYTTLDKFCAGYTNGSSVCNGDSGGGLVFNNQGLWYLRGIVSVSIGSKISDGIPVCNNNLYSLYTKISSHMSWIQDIIFKLETHKNIPPCDTASDFSRRLF